jgi:hypothetical protein
MRSDERLVLMPVLTPGNHRRPGDGACFTEVAAVLSAQRWGDHPGCTPPVLAQVARGVNDTIGAAARTQLAPLIPWAIGPPRPGSDLSSDTAVTAALISLASSRPGCDAAHGPLLRRLQRRPRPHHLLERVGWRHAARQLVRSQLRFLAASTEGPARDEQLRTLLVTAINVDRAASGLPPMPEPPDVPGGPRLLPVLTSVVCRDEAVELHVEPLLERWPDWIRGPWQQRLSELSAGAVTHGEGGPVHPASGRGLAPL